MTGMKHKLCSPVTSDNSLLEVDGKPAGARLRSGAHGQTDGQPENIVQPAPPRLWRGEKRKNRLNSYLVNILCRKFNASIHRRRLFFFSSSGKERSPSPSFPSPQTLRTKKYCSFINYGLSHYHYPPLLQFPTPPAALLAPLYYSAHFSLFIILLVVPFCNI